MAKKKASVRKTGAKKTTKTKSRKLSRRVIWVGIAAGIVILTIAGAWGWNQYDYRFGSAIRRSGTVQIHYGTSFEDLTAMLADSGYLDNERKWRSMARKHDADTVRAGNYRLQPGTSYRTALNTFSLGRQTPVRITFNNIRSVERLAGVVSRYLAADSLTLLQAFRNDSLIAACGLTPTTFPTLFIPNTYEMYWTDSPETFVERMQKEHDRFWNDDRHAAAGKLGYTPEQISTLASIVIEETKYSGEMSDVAGVYLNRLRVGMPLQADPTVKFALGDPLIRRVLRVYLDVDSPYNTYKYAGLPPGPICVPPIQAIDAVLACADKKHDYYYFCAAADFSGRHIFARTLPEHSRNAAAYAAELNRRGIR